MPVVANRFTTPTLARLVPLASRASLHLIALSAKLRRAFRAAWRGLREWCGDAAYETYLRSKHTNCAAKCKLTPEEFYVERLERRYSRPNRCC